ncbi:MAG: hypothetical protein MJ093_03715 [Saccharofermentans sp.]|nr:hypothetical protein [Saccharofermentans sp.]
MSTIRKITSVVLASSLILSIGSMTGCKNTGDSILLNEIKYVSEDDPWYDMTVIDDSLIDYGFSESDTRVLYAGNDYFVEGLSASVFSPDYLLKSIVYKYNYDGERLGEFDISEAFDEGDAFVAYAYSHDGEVYYFIERQILNPESVLYEDHPCVVTIDFDNQTMDIVQELDFSDWYPGTVTVLDVAVSGDYVVYLIYKWEGHQSAFYVFDTTDGSHYYVNVRNDEIGGFLEFNFRNRSCDEADGAIYYQASRAEDYAIYSFDPETGVYAVERTFEQYEEMYFLGDGTYLGSSGSQVYKKNSVTGEEIELAFDLYSSAMSPFYSINVLTIFGYGNDTLFVRASDNNNGLGYQIQKMYLLNKADTNPHAGKPIVTVGYTYDAFIDHTIGGAIEAINSDYDGDYFIQIVDDYYMYSEFAYDGVSWYDMFVMTNDKIFSDIREGTGPDIILGSAPYSAAMPELIYADLNELMNNDDNFDVNNYVAAVREGFTSDHGTYVIPYGLDITGLSVRASSIDQTGFTYDEYVEFVNTHMDGVDPLMRPDDYNQPYTDFEYFENMFALCSDDFMVDGKFDISTGEQGERFTQMATLAKDRDILFHDVEGEDSFIPLESCFFGGFYFYMGNTIVSSKSTPVTVVGYPSYDRISCYSSVAYTASITACCANKEAAWSVITSFLDYDVQVTMTNVCTPVNLDALEAVIDMEIAALDPDDWYWYEDDFDFEPFKDEYIDIVTNMNVFRYADPMIIIIMSEEMPAYFEDQKSLEAVREIIETRVNNYLQEQV